MQITAAKRGEQHLREETMGVEVVEHGGTRYAEVIRATETVDHTTFFSPAESSFQFGLLAHRSGYQEPPHYHQEFTREIHDLQQMFVVQRGVVAVSLYSDDGQLLEEVVLRTGDAIVLIHGVHAIRVIEDLQAISVKQGPFLGDARDKVEVEVRP
jgi:hypothetical protein